MSLLLWQIFAIIHLCAAWERMKVLICSGDVREYLAFSAVKYHHNKLLGRQ